MSSAAFGAHTSKIHGTSTNIVSAAPPSLKNKKTTSLCIMTSILTSCIDHDSGI